MAHQIIKQPNGKYSIYSTITDTIISYEITADELIEYYGNEEKRKAEERTKDIIDKIDKGENPYLQFAVKWEDVKSTIPKEWLSKE